MGLHSPSMWNGPAECDVTMGRWTFFLWWNSRSVLRWIPALNRESLAHLHSPKCICISISLHLPEEDAAGIFKNTMTNCPTSHDHFSHMLKPLKWVQVWWSFRVLEPFVVWFSRIRSGNCDCPPTGSFLIRLFMPRLPVWEGFLMGFNEPFCDVHCFMVPKIPSLFRPRHSAQIRPIFTPHGVLRTIRNHQGLRLAAERIGGAGFDQITFK